MFRRTYSALTAQQVNDGLAVCTAPAVSAPPYGLPTELHVVTDGGPALDYRLEGGMLCFTLDGKTYREACAATKIGEAVLLTHALTGEGRWFCLIWTPEDNLATLIELWFSDPFRASAREAQREIYHGCVACEGGSAPEARHRVTNRLENRAIVWTDEAGKRLLSIYNSVMYSTFVELDEADGGIPIAVPSDYIKLNEEQYLFTRVDAEFSGMAYVEVLDLFDVAKAGVALGLDRNDAPVYALYRHSGEIAGQLATFSKFTDYGGSYSFEQLNPLVLPPEEMKKGRRAVYRVHGVYPDITQEEAKNAGIGAHTFPSTDESIMPSGNSLPDSSKLAGKTFTLRYDEGPVWEYEITGIHTLRWREAGGQWQEETYRAFEPAAGLFLFAHLHTGADYGEAVTCAVDLREGLTTCLLSHIGNGYANREVGFKPLFGVVEQPGGPTPPERQRQGLTTELVGRAFTWNYSDGPDGLSSMHVYSSPWGYSWTIYVDSGEGGMVWTSPCTYIKLREDVYMMSWVEETSAGGQGTVLMNLRTMHDCGFFYGLGEGNRVGLSCLGAYGRDAGRLDIAKYFALRG